MNKTELIEKISQSHDDFLELLEPFSEEEMVAPSLPDGWSIKDVLVHLMLWEAELIRLLFQAQQGRVPQTALISDEPDETINARWYAQHKDHDLEQALKDFDLIRDQTIRRVEAFSDTDLTNPRRFRWLDGKPLWQWVLSSTAEHEEEHAPNLRKLISEKTA
ncbi:MAG TPA: ClbS/DfsB family four-helix bundle protein [Anaerolineales bacterium]|nr:ClbS/DfsB family four-helix bundle protein [Anaerolineales bacterium]